MSGNAFGKVFGLARVRAGQQGLSASAYNINTALLKQVSNIRVLAPLFMRKNGTGIEIGLPPMVGATFVAYPCRVAAPLLNNEPMTPTQLDTPQEPDRLKYRVTPDKRATGPIPPGVNFNNPMAVRYGRAFEAPTKVKAARVGSLCFVCASVDPAPVAELWILDERIGTRVCSPTAPNNGDPPPTPSFAAITSPLASGSASPFPDQFPPDMASTVSSSSFTLDAGKASDESEPFYVGDADYVALSGLIQDQASKPGWTRDLWVYWSPDGRVWTQAQKIDPAGGGKAAAVLNKDDYVTVDAREAVQYVKAGWDPISTPFVSTCLVDCIWTKKRGTSR